jgi:hypothetical protein
MNEAFLTAFNNNLITPGTVLEIAGELFTVKGRSAAGIITTTPRPNGNFQRFSLPELNEREVNIILLNPA